MSDLAAGIVQDHRTGQVLMLGWLNDEALKLTRETGQVHFWSRSRNELWMKGATSGNTLRLVDLKPDCDRDVWLLTVSAAGPACHTGSRSCFDDRELAGFGALEELDRTIADRAQTMPSGSYTASLLEGGVDVAGRKVMEEATEVVLAAKDHASGTEPPERVAAEAADLVYHLLVLLRERGIPASLVVDELIQRADRG